MDGTPPAVGWAAVWSIAVGTAVVRGGRPCPTGSYRIYSNIAEGRLGVVPPEGGERPNVATPRSASACIRRCRCGLPHGTRRGQGDERGTRSCKRTAQGPAPVWRATSACGTRRRVVRGATRRGRGEVARREDPRPRAACATERAPPSRSWRVADVAESRAGPPLRGSNSDLSPPNGKSGGWGG